MPNDKNFQRFYPPDTPQQPAPKPEEGLADESVEQREQEAGTEEELEQSQERKPGWDWVGSPSRPEAQESPDGISDLFEVPTDDDTEDLVSVDIERDIMDGNLDDLTEVSEEDILGDEETGQVPLEYKPDAPRRKVLPRYRRTPTRYTPPASLGGMNG